MNYKVSVTVSRTEDALVILFSKSFQQWETVSNLVMGLILIWSVTSTAVLQRKREYAC